ncbi:hypothetical protein OROGR_011432 [Orobanche gracilis]
MLKMSLRTLIGRSFFSNGLRDRYMGLPIANSYGFSRFNSFKASPVLQLSQENPNSIYYEVEEAKGGSDNDPLIPMANCTKKEVEKEEFTNIKKGDIFNLSDILFTKYRDYLVKCNEDLRRESSANRIAA